VVEEARVLERPDRDLRAAEPGVDGVEARRDRVRRRAADRRQQLRLAPLDGAVQDEQRADVVAIVIDVRVEMMFTGGRAAWAIRPVTSDVIATAEIRASRFSDSNGTSG
jgi:hypothetical protein